MDQNEDPHLAHREHHFIVPSLSIDNFVNNIFPHIVFAVHSIGWEMEILNCEEARSISRISAHTHTDPPPIDGASI